MRTMGCCTRPLENAQELEHWCTFKDDALGEIRKAQTCKAPPFH